jgi:hypothetical protein
MNEALTELVKRRVEAKRAEDAAADTRKKIDSEIAAALAKADTLEGTVSEKLEGFKVAVTYGITRKVDVEKIRNDWAKLPKEVQDSINWKAELSVSKFRALEGEAALTMSNYVESKPASPSVKVEIL